MIPLLESFQTSALDKTDISYRFDLACGYFDQNISMIQLRVRKYDT